MGRKPADVTRKLEEIMDRQCGVVSRRQALRQGMSDDRLRSRLGSGGTWQRILPGVYGSFTGTPAPFQKLVAAQLYGGAGAVITGPAALECHRIWRPDTDIIDLLIAAALKRRDYAFVRVRRTTRMPDRIWRQGPLQFALAPRAVADTVVAMDDLRSIRQVVSSSVQRGRCTVSELMVQLSQGPTIGSALFREALSDVVDGIRSTAEADLKDLIKGSGLEMPLFNPEVWDGDTLVAIPDAWWPECGVAVEIDSREYHLGPEDHEYTLDRGRRMAKSLILVHRFTPKQLRREQRRVLGDIAEGLAGARGRPPLPLRTIAVDDPEYGIWRRGIRSN
jgi:hypothetical protein